MLYHYTLFPLEKFLSILLSILHGFTGSYLLALILLSIVVRLITTPLEKLASKSVIKEHDISSVLAPKITQIKEKFKGGERHEAIKREADRLILQSQSGSRALGDWGIMEKLLELDRMPSKKSATRLRELVKDETGEKNLPRNKKILKSHVYNLLKSRNYDFSQLDDILEEERSRAN